MSKKTAERSSLPMQHHSRTGAAVLFFAFMFSFALVFVLVSNGVQAGKSSAHTVTISRESLVRRPEESFEAGRAAHPQNIPGKPVSQENSLAGLGYSAATQEHRSGSSSIPGGDSGGRSDKSRANPEKVQQVIFVMGVEGTGHHGLKPLLHEMASKSGTQMYEANNPNVPFGRATRNCINARDAKCLQRVVGEAVEEQLKKQRGTVIVFKGSLPGRKGNRRGECLFWENASRVDCMEEIAKEPVYDLAWVWHTIEPVVPNLKAVLLNRNFPNLVASHQQWDGGLDQHSQTMAVFLQYICHILRTVVPTTDWVRLDYDSFADVGTAKLVMSLGLFLGWDTEWVASTHEERFHASSRNASVDLPPEEIATIQNVMRDYKAAGKWTEIEDASHFLLDKYPPRLK